MSHTSISTNSEGLIAPGLLAFALTVLTSALTAAPTPCLAQLNLTEIMITTRTYEEGSSCESAPEGSCELSTYQETTGVYEFLVHAPVGGYDPEGLAHAEFTLEAPGDWIVLEWEACRGAPQSGDPSLFGSRLVFDFDCIPGPPVLRMVISCPSPGRISVENPEISCGGFYIGPNTSYVDIGDFCGRLLIIDPCMGRTCEKSSGWFKTPFYQSELDAGSTTTDTLEVDVILCLQIPECDDDYVPYCFGQLTSSQPWVQATHLADQDPLVPQPFQLTLDASELTPGTYQAKVYLNEGSLLGTCCQEVCMDVELTVTPPSPVRRKTWGGLKGREARKP